MIIQCIGHASFLIELESGYRIVTDPYDASTGYPVVKTPADAVLVSHHHGDHDAVGNVTGWTVMNDKPGKRTLASGVTVRGVETYHDSVNGAKRGKNVVHVIEAEGLRVVHLGDLGHELTKEQVVEIGNADILLVPVGGFYTIDALAARSVCSQLKARVVVPMHYRTEYNAGWPIAPVDGFLTLFPWEAERVDLLRVTKADLDCQPRLVILKPIV